MPIFPRVHVDACPLCSSPGPLQNSHIISRFVFDWLIRTSSTGGMRLGLAPNVRMQDGPRQPLLCHDCEEKFSSWETPTASILFRPYHLDSSAVIPYGPWLSRFCASIAWRALFVCPEPEWQHLTANQRVLAREALQVWRDFMFGIRPNPGRFELHILPVDVLSDIRWDSQVPPNLNRYLSRAVQLDIVATADQAFVYAKLCKLIVIGFIETPAGVRQWHRTRLAIRQGVIEPSKYVVPTGFGRYLLDQAKRIEGLHASMSDRQKEKIDAASWNDLDRVANSETFRAMRADVAMFGRLAFRDGSE